MSPRRAVDDLTVVPVDPGAVVAVDAELIAAVPGPGAPVPRRRGRLALWLPMVWVLLVVGSAVLAPVLPLDDPNRSDFRAVAVAPLEEGHVLGTDSIGRDTLARVAWGGRVALTVGLAAVAAGMLVGGAVGVVAGYYRGRIETLLMAAIDVLLAFPALVLVIAITAFLGNSLRNVAIAVAVVAMPAFARVARASTLVFAQREFVTAARAMGATNRRIILREIVPNVLLPLSAFALVVVAVAIVAEGGLAFLGLSVAAPKPSWGGMINEGRDKLDGKPYISLIPASVMFLTVLSLNLLGDLFRSRFDVREGAI